MVVIEVSDSLVVFDCSGLILRNCAAAWSYSSQVQCIHFFPQQCARVIRLLLIVSGASRLSTRAMDLGIARWCSIFVQMRTCRSISMGRVGSN